MQEKRSARHIYDNNSKLEFVMDGEASIALMFIRKRLTEMEFELQEELPNMTALAMCKVDIVNQLSVVLDKASNKDAA